MNWEHTRMNHHSAQSTGIDCMHIIHVLGNKTCGEETTCDSEERMCLYPPNGRWYRAKILQQQKGLLVYLENFADKLPPVIQSQKLHCY